MKHLLNGVAIAAALAIAAPAMAQAPMSPSGGKPAAASPAAAPAAAAPKQKHRAMRHHAMARHGKMRGGRMARGGGGGDSMTAQLNREELSRIQGGGMAGSPMNAPPAAMQGGPSTGGRR